MAQGPRKRLHIHAILERKCGEKMPHIVEADVFRADCLQDFVVDMPEGIRIVHRAGFRRREHIQIAWVFLMLFGQQVHRLPRDCQRPDGVLCLRLANHQLAVDAVDLLGDRDCSGLYIQVRP